MGTKELLASWRLTNKILKRFFFASLIIVIVVLILRLWPECLALGEEIGNVVTTICLSYVMGFFTTFLWNHVRAAGDLRRNRELRDNIIEVMAACHNTLFKGIIEGTAGIAPYAPPDYTLTDNVTLNELVRQGFDREFADEESPRREELVGELYQIALTSFCESFEDIGPFLGQFHPTFVIGLNRIRRELKIRVHVGDERGFNAIAGPKMQFDRIREHIQWLRLVNNHIGLETRSHLWGAIPMVSFEDLGQL